MGEQHPTVSVIIPTYNRAGYLQEAIASVLAQTFGDFEILVVDDGSSDATASVVAGFHDSRIRYFYQENAGRSAARNRGLRLSKGEFIGFLDDDDLYLPTRLASHVSFLEDRPSLDAAVSGTEVVDENGVILATLRPWQGQPELTLLSCLYACPIPTCSVLLRRRVLSFVTYWFDPEMDLAEDTDLFIRLLYAGMRISWFPQVTGVRRLHPGTSQGDGAAYGRAYIWLLDKLFAQPDIRKDLAKERQALYAHHHFIGACHAYATKQVAAAKHSMRQALVDRSDVALEQALADAVGHIVSFASTFRVSDPTSYINFVFDNFPDLGVSVVRYRRDALGALYMRRVFTARGDGKKPSAKDLVLGIFHAPHWVGNRGVWSILVKHVLGIRRPDGPPASAHCRSIAKSKNEFASRQKHE